MSKQQRIIYGYDTLNHEKYHCSVDNFIDNYKQFAKDSFFLVFHSKEDRDSFALDSYREELLCDGDHYPIPNDPSATKDAKNYLDNLKDINLDVAFPIYKPKYIP
jgi:hypothetical protein